MGKRFRRLTLSSLRGVADRGTKGGASDHLTNERVNGSRNGVGGVSVLAKKQRLLRSTGRENVMESHNSPGPERIRCVKECPLQENTFSYTI